MCGINGFNWEDELLAKRMNAAIRHRGPDDSGIYSSKKVSISHVRLSIIDLSSAGHQPMFYDKKKGGFSITHQMNMMNSAKLGIVFNGEIYNYQDIKNELIQKGYVFSTKTDTEVILASYLEWGYSCVNRFNGMWAFSIYDKRKEILFCSRDRLGVKPFYYYSNKKKFIFSSEIKGILAHKSLELNKKININKTARQLYFAYGFIPSPYSIYTDVYKLEAGHNLIYDLKNSRISKIKKYYEIPEFKPIFNEKKLIAEGRAILNDAVRIRMIADVPVGAFLSGGLDSSAIVGTMKEYTDLKNLHTFSIGFEGEYDESRFIKLAKNYYGTKHHHCYFYEKDFRNLIKAYSIIYDEPFADYSGFPTYHVSKMAREKVTVALSGEGGDEIFGGYKSHLAGKRLDLIYTLPLFMRWIGSKIPAKRDIDGFSSIYLLSNAFKMSLHVKKHAYTHFLPEETYKPDSFKEFSSKKLGYSLGKGNNLMSEALRIYDLNFNTLQDHFLVKSDRASMANALEVRSPFLDYRFVEYSQRIPAHLKVSFSKTKILMRKLIKGLVPEQIIKRGKQGFTPPMDKWILKETYISEMKKNIGLLADEPMLYKFYQQKVFAENNKRYNIYKIRLFLYMKWHQEWID